MAQQLPEPIKIFPAEDTAPARRGPTSAPARGTPAPRVAPQGKSAPHPAPAAHSSEPAHSRAKSDDREDVRRTDSRKTEPVREAPDEEARDAMADAEGEPDQERRSTARGTRRGEGPVTITLDLASLYQVRGRCYVTPVTSSPVTACLKPRAAALQKKYNIFFESSEIRHSSLLYMYVQKRSCICIYIQKHKLNKTTTTTTTSWQGLEPRFLKSLCT